MIEPTEEDIGRKVIYYGYEEEHGVITSFNDVTVFVRYGDDSHSKSTSREDLEYDC